jgi:hypothetical protein
MRLFAWAIAVTLLYFGSIGFANAGSCENILIYSRVMKATAWSKDDFLKERDAHCQEHQSSSSNSGGGGISIPGVADISGSGSHSSIDWQQYCQDRENGAISDLNYRDYIDTVAPEAFDAYEQCQKSTDVDFDLTAITPTTLTMLVSFKPSTTNNTAQIAYVVTGDHVSCLWQNQQATLSQNAPIQSIGHGQTFVLQCRRESYKQETPITLYRVDAADDSERMTIPWRKYNDDGQPVDTINDLLSLLSAASKETDRARSDIDAIKKMPMITVYQCPFGPTPGSGGGQWASVGCLGQLSTQQKCHNVVWKGSPAASDFPMNCEKVGLVHYEAVK